MKIPIVTFLVLCAFTVPGHLSRAEIAITINHRTDAPENEPFHFDSVPAPRPTVALGAAFKLVDGDPDGNSASIDVLHDGQLPEREDQPDANFFFQNESEGGRLLMDLGKVTPISEVDTYSWHPGTRAPQVYRLYGSDGEGAGFVAEPKRPADPAQGGWKLIATVDTRTRFNLDGGPYGVRVADTAGPLGRFRYLLFDVARTENDDSFGNTFFSEIDVSAAIYLGVTLEPASEVLRAQLALEPGSGMVVNDLVADGPAARAGLQKNDVLTRLDDQLLIDPAQVVALVQTRRDGDTVRVSYVRRGRPETTAVKLGVDPRPAGREAPDTPGGITVTMDHNEGAAATSGFKFATVPSPRPSAALDAAWYTKGEPDANSAPVDALHDGKLPGEEDQPDANFFFEAGTEGGGLMMDLGKPVAIKEVDTYSWHPGTRAPQVYQLLGRESDDEKSDWKTIAEVDTRKQFGHDGGQYGVRVAAKGDEIIGRYQYLCFYVARTEDDDDFGNTFYSEIDVLGSDAPPAPKPPARSARQTSSYDRQNLHLVFTDDSGTCDPKEKEGLVDTFFTVYPQITAKFNHDAPRSAEILLDPKFHGIAETAGTTIRCSSAWFRDHPEDLDTLTHESVHVAQQYKQWEPAWITEGIADYGRARFGVNNPATGWTMPEYAPNQSYRDSYRITARFFVWLEKHVEPGIVVALDQAMREGKYTPAFWPRQTGKSLDDLWQDYGKNPAL